MTTRSKGAKLKPNTDLLGYLLGENEFVILSFETYFILKGFFGRLNVCIKSPEKL